MSSRKQRGFTLIELVISITVAIILATLGATAMGDFIMRSRVRAAADDLTGQIALARAEAMRADRDTNVKVVSAAATTWCAGGRQFNITSGTVGLTMASGAAPVCDCSDATDVANCVIAAKTSLVKSSDYSGVDLVTGAGASLAFSGKLGTLTNLTSQTLTLRSHSKPNRYRLNIVVSPMGHARVCVPSGFVSFGGYESC